MKERGEQQVVTALPAAPLLFHEQCRPEMSMAGPAVQNGSPGQGAAPALLALVQSHRHTGQGWS